MYNSGHPVSVGHTESLAVVWDILNHRPFSGVGHTESSSVGHTESSGVGHTELSRLISSVKVRLHGRYSSARIALELHVLSRIFLVKIK